MTATITPVPPKLPKNGNPGCIPPWLQGGGRPPYGDIGLDTGLVTILPYPFPQRPGWIPPMEAE